MINKPKTESKEEKTKEGIISNFILRLFLYPFCAFYIWYSITELIPNALNSTSPIKNSFVPIISAVLFLVYPISDLIIVFKKDKSDK